MQVLVDIELATSERRDQLFIYTLDLNFCRVLVKRTGKTVELENIRLTLSLRRRLRYWRNYLRRIKLANKNLSTACFASTFCKVELQRPSQVLIRCGELLYFTVLKAHLIEILNNYL